jgi:predicted transcriptional regulator
MSRATTIKIDTDLRDRLNALKIHPRETYSEVIGRLVEQSVDDEPLSDETIRALEASLEDLKAGRVCTLDEVMAELRGE